MSDITEKRVIAEQLLSIEDPQLFDRTFDELRQLLHDWEVTYTDYDDLRLNVSGQSGCYDCDAYDYYLSGERLETDGEVASRVRRSVAGKKAAAIRAAKNVTELEKKRLEDLALIENLRKQYPEEFAQ